MTEPPRQAYLYGASAGALLTLGAILIPVGYWIGDLIGPVVLLFMLLIPLLWAGAAVFAVLAVLAVVRRS